jgi:alpha-N-acetylglucosamine transferase
MSADSSPLPFSSSSDRAAHLTLSTRLQYVLSVRKLRIAFIIGGLFLLAGVFLRFDEHIVRLPPQFREFTKHNATSAKELVQCPSPAAEDNTVWSDFAYVQYVTNPNYLCNSLMIFEALRRHGTKDDLLMLYPQEWNVPKHVFEDDASPIEYEGGLLAQARDQYQEKLNPIEVKTYVNENDATWQDSYTKLLAWNQTQYKHVISLDSDATLLDVGGLLSW